MQNDLVFINQTINTCFGFLVIILLSLVTLWVWHAFIKPNQNQMKSDLEKTIAGLGSTLKTMTQTENAISTNLTEIHQVMQALSISVDGLYTDYTDHKRQIAICRKILKEITLSDKKRKIDQNTYTELINKLDDTALIARIGNARQLALSTYRENVHTVISGYIGMYEKLANSYLETAKNLQPIIDNVIQRIANIEISEAQRNITTNVNEVAGKIRMMEKDLKIKGRPSKLQDFLKL